MACFASHVHRVQQVMDAAVTHGRKVAYVGRSMVRNMAIARDLGYLNGAAGRPGRRQGARRPAARAQVLISTGSQGEPLSALSRIAQRNHHFVHIEEGDTVVLASSLIPGNENAVYRVINGLARWGANVVHKGNALVHVSGHASAGELLYCYNIVKPRNVMPVHGEIRHMRANAELARATGVPPENVVIAEDGVVVDLSTARPGSRQGRLRLRLRRRLVGRRHHRGLAEGPPDPRRGGLHLGDRGDRLGHRQGGRRARRSTPAASPRTTRSSTRSSSRSSTRSTRPLARASTTLPAPADDPPRGRPLGQQHPPAPADDHPGRHRGLATIRACPTWRSPSAVGGRSGTNQLGSRRADRRRLVPAGRPWTRRTEVSPRQQYLDRHRASCRWVTSTTSVDHSATARTPAQAHDQAGTVQPERGEHTWAMSPPG